MARPRRDDKMILRIARLRYEDRQSQVDIARLLGLSEATVSRCLKLAMELGFVEVRVAPHALRNVDLEQRLARRFDLAKVLVVEGRDSAAETRHLLGGAVARALEAQLGDGEVIGVSDGDTAAAVAAAARPGRSSDVDVVTLIGGVGRAEEPSHSSEVCRTLASGLGGRAWQLPVPALADDAQVAATLRGLGAVQTVFLLMERLSHAVVGVGTMSTRATVFRHGVISPDYLREITAQGAVGTICGRFYDGRGRALVTAFDDRTMSIDLETLSRARMRFAVSVGAEKSIALRAALEGGIVNCLGTDVATATTLLAAGSA